ncbi:MAG: biopolymer transporter ExbD [Deltaproteobacteria bacterium]|nr:biopolymer transporter ExbD [Deltaproteobacteria bacterium]
MLIRRKKRPVYAIQAPLTSLIDIVFMLLIYFLLTTNFMSESGIDVHLPSASGAVPQTEREITVFVDSSGRTFIGELAVDFNELFPKLKTMIASDPDRVVVIRADRTVALQDAVNVMDIARAAGASRLFLATEKRAGPAGP